MASRRVLLASLNLDHCPCRTRAMYSSDEDFECKLRRHVDDLLLDYAHEHLTTDYVQSSEALAHEARVFSSCPSYILCLDII